MLMASNEMAKAGAPSAAEMKALLGPPPILSTESAEQFEKVFDQLIDCLELQDMVDGILIREFAVSSWEINRYVRHRTVSFDRSFKQNRDLQVQRLKSQKARKEDLAANLARHLAQSPADISQMEHLETRVTSVDSEIDEILRRTPSELDHNAALEKGIMFHKELEFLITSLTKRRNEALEMLEFYRAGLGKHVANAMNEILDAEYKVVQEQPQQVGSPSLVPVATNEADNRSAETSAGPIQENSNDFGTPNSSEPTQQPQE
jgi:PIN domain nuclease of toxin-antitoxin system